jgi:Rrf2 family iron-sulfur cluster assembly transcriptional regulator
MAMADLARHGVVGASVPLGEIAHRQDLSLAYLEQLFAKLRRAGLVESARGPGGGYRLARPARDISIAAVIAAADGPLKATGCPEGAAESCTGRLGRCIAHDLWDELGRQADLFLSAVTLEDVIRKRVRGRARPPIAVLEPAE